MNIEFKAVTKENYEDVIKLNVKAKQKHFIETTKECLNEANEFKLWRPKAMYIDNLLVGFAMYGLWKNEGQNGRVWLDRFLIDEKYQGNGYGEALLDKLIEKIIEEYNIDELFLSIYESNVVAQSLYKKCGFKFNGETDINGEIVMALSWVPKLSKKDII